MKTVKLEPRTSRTGTGQPVRELLRQINRLDFASREALLHKLAGQRTAKRPDKRRPHISSALDFPSVVRTPGVCGGSARLVRTRIPIWILEDLRRRGCSEAEMLRSYPALRSIDLVEAWSYADLHRAEIEGDMRENEADDDAET